MAKTTSTSSAKQATTSRTAAKPNVAGTAPTTATEATASGAIEMLQQDHRRVEKLFAEYEAASDEGRKDELVKQICTELIIHTKLEEEIFYPACRAAFSEDDILDEAQVEHDSAKMLIADLIDGRSNDRFRDAKVSVLSEQIKHHVAEEEKPREGTFAQARAQGVDLARLGKQLKDRKEDLQGRAAALRPTRAVSLTIDPTNQQERPMARYGNGGRERDERGRFMDDDDRYERRSYGRGGPERDERGRFMSDDDDDYRRSASRGGPERDERGRFMSDDDDDDRRSSGRGRGGWFGDSEGHSQAARERWEDDRRSGRGGYRGDDDEGRGDGRGWYGDSEGHARAARERWEDDRRGPSRSRGREDDDRGGRGHGGWYGDSEGHSRAASQRSGDDRRRSTSSRRDDDGRGWYGDSRGHAEAAHRGWEHRR